MTTIPRVHQENLTGLSIAGQGFLALVVDMYGGKFRYFRWELVHPDAN